MGHSIMVGSAVACNDGKVGSVAGLLINPNRSHVDYVILNPGLLGGREYFVPSGQIQRLSADQLSLPFGWDELENLPRPELWTKQGTVQDNLSDLCMARKHTPVYGADGAMLGYFHGATVDSEFAIQSVILDQAPDRAIAISKIARHSANSDAVVVYLVNQLSN